MKEIKLLKSKYGQLCAMVDDKNFDYLSQWNWGVKKGRKTFYAIRTEQKNKIKRQVWMHREIMNTPENLCCDHIDGNGLNCQEYNLRNCTSQQNRFNSTSVKNSSSQYLGVSRKVTKASWKLKSGEIKTKEYYSWGVGIQNDREKYHIAYFKTQEEAALAYNEVAIKLRGEFANLNKVYCNPCIIDPNNLIQKFNQI